MQPILVCKAGNTLKLSGVGGYDDGVFRESLSRQKRVVGADRCSSFLQMQPQPRIMRIHRPFKGAHVHRSKNGFNLGGQPRRLPFGCTETQLAGHDYRSENGLLALFANAPCNDPLRMTNEVPQGCSCPGESGVSTS